MRNQSWLNDAYQASTTRRPMPMGGSSGTPALGGPMFGAPSTPGASGPVSSAPTSPAMPPLPKAGVTPSTAMSGMPALSGAAGVGTTPQVGMMKSLLAAMQQAHSADTNQNGIPDSQEGGGATGGVPSMPNLQPAATTPAPTLAGTTPATPPSLGAGGPVFGKGPHSGVTPGRTGGFPGSLPPPPTYAPPPTAAPPGPLPPGQSGPGPTNPRTPAEIRANDIWWDTGPGSEGWKQYGPYNNAGAGTNANAWLNYILSDPYNRQITDASERDSLDATNTAFDSARGRMKADALQSGAGESGVARGMSKAMELARGATQAKNVRDFEKYKTTTGDQRLEQMGLGWLNSSPWGKGTLNNNSGNQGPGWAEQLLPIALALIAA